MVERTTGRFYSSCNRVEWNCPYCNKIKGYMIGKLSGGLTILAECIDCNKTFIVTVENENRANIISIGDHNTTNVKRDVTS